MQHYNKREYWQYVSDYYNNLQGESDTEVGQLGQLGQFGQAHILNSNYYNLLIINDSNILEEKNKWVVKLANLANLTNFSDKIAEDERC